MTVNKHNEQGKDHRSQPRWSAGKKTEAVLRLLRAHGLLAPQRARGRRRPRPHDGTIIRATQPALGHRCHHGLDSIGWLGIADDAAFLGEPETNGCAERWTRTLKEQCLWAELHNTVDQLRQAVAGFVQTYNSQWLIGRLGHRTPKEAYQAAQITAAA